DSSLQRQGKAGRQRENRDKTGQSTTDANGQVHRALKALEQELDDKKQTDQNICRTKSAETGGYARENKDYADPRATPIQDAPDAKASEQKAYDRDETGA